MFENGMVVGAERHDPQCRDIECSRCTCCKLWVPDDELVAFSNGDRVCNDCLYDYLSNQGADFVPGYIAEHEADFWLDWMFEGADEEEKLRVITAGYLAEMLDPEKKQAHPGGKGRVLPALGRFFGLCEGGVKLKSVLERMEENDTKRKIANFQAWQKEDYEFKKAFAEEAAWRFFESPEISGNCYVAVGGLDSITLLLFLRSIGIDVPAISVSALEDKSIQKIHKQLGVQSLPPFKSKIEVIREYGFPVLSKEIAGKISLLQNPSEKNKTVRHAIITGETGAYGGWQKNSRMKLSQKWLEKFGGYENENEGVDYGMPDFKVSDKCCYYLKEKPCNDYARESGRYPYMGLMASEGGRRQKALMIHGCNYIGKTTKRSCPFAIFNRQDLLRLALELDAPVPEIYGEIVQDSDGTLRTTKAQRTGCSMCGFGIHMETRPHRFDLLYQTNPKEWEMWMNHIIQREDGSWYGWGHALNYIGVEWQNPEVYTDDYQIKLEEGLI